MTKQQESMYGVFYGDSIKPPNERKVPLFEGFLYRGDVKLIHGKGGIGKTGIVNQIAFSATAGTNLFDTFRCMQKMNVCYIQLESDRSETYERWEAMKEVLEFDPSHFVHVFLAGTKINEEQSCKELFDYMAAPILKGHCGLYDIIILDCLYVSMRGSERDDNVVSDWIRNYNTYIRDKFPDSATIVLHHPKKDHVHNGQSIESDPEDVCGSKNWNAFFSSIYKVTKKKQKQGVADDHKRHMAIGKARSRRHMAGSFDLKFDTETETYSIDVKGKAGKILDILKGHGKMKKSEFKNVAASLLGISASAVLYHINGNKKGKTGLLDLGKMSEMKVNGHDYYVYNGDDNKEEVVANG